MVIGVVRTDGVMTPLPPAQRALDDAVLALRAAGVRVVEMDITSVFSQCQSLANALMAVDGANTAFDIMDRSGEPLSPWLQGRLRRKPPRSLADTRDLQARRAALQARFLQIWREETGERRVDAFICPVAPHPVPPIDRWNGVSYTSSFNLLDVPAGVLPVRPLRESDLVGELPETKPIGSWDSRNRELWSNIDRKVYLGSVLSIQVVAPRLQERRLLGAMAIIDDALRRYDFGQSSSSRL
jgi:Asp-tRNA(Asn)/Glu-tRNA(Gln) amidotransferase A subunit family amidase